jgi:hypothetical protein
MICSDHYSIASFTQGIFDTRSLDLKRKVEVVEWLKNNKSIVKSIECFLLKHPLFDVPLPAYPMFSFIHHAQIGFIFKDKDCEWLFCSLLDVVPTKSGRGAQKQPVQC